MVPLAHPPGDAQADFGEALVVPPKARRPCTGDLQRCARNAGGVAAGEETSRAPVTAAETIGERFARDREPSVLDTGRVADTEGLSSQQAHLSWPIPPF